jgi:hypothetical protein
MSCEACDRPAEGRFCRFHDAARRSVEDGFAAWKAAYGPLEWPEYLDRIKRNPGTGQWAKEVAKILAGGVVDKTAS